MLSAPEVARCAFPPGYTCQSGARLSVGRPAPREEPNVCWAVCVHISSSELRDSGMKEGEREEEWQRSLFRRRLSSSGLTVHLILFGFSFFRYLSVTTDGFVAGRRRKK